MIQKGVIVQVPVRVMISKIYLNRSSFLDSALNGVYNKSGEQLFLIDNHNEPAPSFNYPEEHYEGNCGNCGSISPDVKIHPFLDNEYTDEMFVEQISLNSFNQMESFLEKYVKFPFLSTDSHENNACYYGIHLGNLVTRNEYISIALNKIKAFSQIKKAYDALAEHYKNRNEETACKALKTSLDLFISQQLIYKMGLSEDDAKNPVFKTDENTAALIFKSNGSNKKRITLAECRDRIEDIIKIETNSVSIIQRLDDFAFEIFCPSLSVAMYEKLLISLFGGVKYEQCAHKKCFSYFKVDNHHPQKLCDVHMASRRRKRKNYMENQKREDKEAWDDVNHK